MRKSLNKIFVLVFIISIFGTSLLNLLLPDKEFSEAENRILTQLPEFNWKNIKSGRFTKKFEEYITDQFIYRDILVGVKSDLERLILKKENNDIFFGKDGYLLEDYRKPDGQLNENINSINLFSSKLPNINISLLLVPNSIKVYEDKLPLFASPYDQLKTIEFVKGNLKKDINFINSYDVLFSKKDENIFFKTDHHWTMRGAFYAYQALLNSLGVEPYDISAFDLQIVSKSFYGTFYSKGNNRHIQPDFIEIFKPKADIKYEVFYLENGKTSDSLYQKKYLDTKDKYSFFLDGNHALMTIKTNVNNKKRIAIFKDSYANCFISFLANHYEEIHVFDLRYSKFNVYQYIQEHQIGEALFIHNVSTFSTDKSINWLR